MYSRVQKLPRVRGDSDNGLTNGTTEQMERTTQLWTSTVIDGLQFS